MPIAFVTSCGTWGCRSWTSPAGRRPGSAWRAWAIRPGSDLDWRALSPRHLAYLGDAVYELHVRLHQLGVNLPIEVLHKAKIGRVRAGAQARALHALMPMLSEAEREVVRKARNLKTSVPRNVSLKDYRYSTAFEALLGYLYLTHPDRLAEILVTTDRILMEGSDAEETPPPPGP